MTNNKALDQNLEAFLSTISTGEKFGLDDIVSWCKRHRGKQGGFYGVNSYVRPLMRRNDVVKTHREPSWRCPAEYQKLLLITEVNIGTSSQSSICGSQESRLPEGGPTNIKSRKDIHHMGTLPSDTTKEE